MISQEEMIKTNKRKFTKSITCLEVLLLLLFGCSLPPKPFMPDKSSKPNYKDAIEYSRKYLEYSMKKTGAIGLAVAIVDSDKVIYSEGFGYADKDAKKKVSDFTTFRTGSTGKLFTATAIMQLVEQGSICIDSPITAYLPEFKIKSRFGEQPITVKDLLTHESGLPSDIQNGGAIGQRLFPGGDTTYRTVVALCENEYVANPPRTVMSYSNLGFSLLGCIVERMSKRSFAEYIEDSIFSRISMNQSAVGFTNPRVMAAFSKGYFGEKCVDPVYIRDIPAGNMVTSVTDLSRFVRMLLCGGVLDNRRVLSQKTLDQMWTQQNSDISLDYFKMGLCYWLSEGMHGTITAMPEKIVHHGGDIPPFHTMLAFLPNAKFGVVVMTNSEQGSNIPTDAAWVILETFFEAKMGNKIVEPQRKREPIVKLSRQRLQNLAGHYQASEDIVEAEIKRGELVIDFFGKPVRLVPHSDSTFSLRYKMFGLIPFPNKQLRNLRLDLHKSNNKEIAVLFYNDIFTGLIAEKIEPQLPLQSWLERVGTYEITNDRKPVFTDSITEKHYYNKECTLSYDSAGHVLRLCNLPLKTISSSEAVTSGIGRNAGETVRAYKSEDAEYLWFSGLALKRKPLQVK